MSQITTHVLDVVAGVPGAGIPVLLERRTDPDDWQMIGKGMTNAEGRVTDLLSTDGDLLAGHYRLIFDTGKYFARDQSESFYPQVTIVFRVADQTQHYHVPLLLSPFGYSTYRGS